MTSEVKGEAHTLRAGFELLCKFWESNGQVPIAGSKVESWVRQTGTFSEVNVHEAVNTIGSQASPGTRHARTPPTRTLLMGRLDPRPSRWRRAFSGKTHPGLLALGFTPEFKERLLEEYDASEWQLDCPLYCVWARKSG